MATSIIKIIDLKNFPIERTVFYLLQEPDQRKERVKNEIKSWKEKFPSAVEMIEKYEKKSEKEFNGMDETDNKSVLNYFYSFNIENDILNLIKPETAQRIGDLLKIGGGNEIDELVKEVAREQQADLESEIKSWKAGVIGLVFLLESVEKYYLTELPKYINEKLTIEPVVSWGGVDLRTNLSNIFSTLYAGFRDTEKETNFKDFQEGINKELGEIKTLIDGTRKTKEPTEDIEAIKKDLETKTKELNDLKEAWKLNFADRGIVNEYLKNKELSVDAIVEAGESLKTYDNTFSYMDSKHNPNLVKEWWNKVRTYWKENFLNKYGIGGGIEDTTLIKLKKNILEKKEEMEVIIQDKSKLMTDKKDLEQLAKDLFATIKSYDENPDLLYNATPTPPNSPETNPVKPDDDVPPINKN